LSQPNPSPVTPVPVVTDAAIATLDHDINADTVKPLEPLQRAALWSALGIGVLILLIATPLTIGWLIGAPPAPSLEGLTPEQSKVAVDTYRELVQIHEAAAQTRFDTIILKALLPILTLTLGYVFGSQLKRD
jgi:hypothetical protein